MILLDQSNMKQNVISLAEYKKKKKDITWLFSLSEYELICEFIDSHNEYEKDASNQVKMNWLDTVSDVVSMRCFDKASQ